MSSLKISYKIYLEAEDISQSRIQSCTSFVNEIIKNHTNSYLNRAKITDECDMEDFVLRLYAEEEINEYDLTLFIPEKDGLYRKFAETHYQRNYAVETLQEMLHKAGFTAIAIYDDYTDAPLCQTSERAVFVAKKSR